MHLLQLTGGQPWPNFLPILALKPSKVTFLISADPKGIYQKSIEAIQAALKEQGVSFDLISIKTHTENPSIQDCREILAMVNPDIVNITGGTKPMSIAAYLMAQQSKIPSFYLDTRRSSCEAFELTDTSEKNVEFAPLGELANSIDVRTALMAQGFAVPESFAIPSAEDLAFSKQAAQIRRDSEANKRIGNYIFNLREQFVNLARNKLFEKGKLRSALKQSFVAEAGTSEYEYFVAASENELVTQMDSETDFRLTSLDPDDSSIGSKTLRSVASHNFKLLEGVWFELALLDHLQQQSCYSDICWSVESESENSDSIGETDLVAFNKETLTLHFISCKVSGPHGSSLDHIQGLRRRATKEGGRFSKAELWIFAPKSEASKEDLEKHCKEQNVLLRVLSEELV